MAYVKYSNVSDSVAELLGQIDSEPDPDIRKETIVSLIEEISIRLSDTLARCCYEMKTNGTPTDVIAVDFNLSQRNVIRLIRAYSVKHGVRNPLVVTVVNDYIDLRDLAKFV